MQDLDTSPTVAGNLLLQARLRASLSQGELARRSGTEERLIEAYERGVEAPGFETLMHLLRAAGFDLRLRLTPRDDHDESLETWRKTLSQKDLRELRRHRAEFVREAQKSLSLA